MLSAPLKLTKMTLRGLGPYLRGAELFIKPLTILCGENVSGKSTWIEMLMHLRESASEPSFPFCCGIGSDQGDITTSYHRNGMHIELLKAGTPLDPNYKYQCGPRSDEVLAWCKQQRLGLMKPGEEEDCGPAGCIGLEIQVTRDLNLNLDVPPADSLAILSSDPDEPFLQSGKLQSETKLKIRWAAPFAAIFDDDLPRNGFENLILQNGRNHQRSCRCSRDRPGHTIHVVEQIEAVSDDH